MITINPSAADVITINISDADQITLNTTAILLEDRDVDTLQGENGAFYLDRDNHAGTQAVSTIGGLQAALDSKLESVAWGGITGTLSDQTDLQDALDTLTDTDIDLQDALDLKLDIADYNDRFLGLFSSVFDLEAAHPTASAGDYAQVDFGIGMDVIVYAWDVSDAQWSAVGGSAIANTDALPEGSSNLYLTGQRVRDTSLTGLSTATATPITAADSVLSAAGKLQAQINAGGSLNISLDPASLSDAGAALPTDQLVIYRNGTPMRTTVAQLGLAPTPPSVDLLLIPTGAVESVDGDYQRFAYDGTNTFDFEFGGSSYQIPIWYADLPLANRQSEYQISLKMPDLVEFGSARLYLVDADFDLDFFLSPSSLNHLLLQLRPEDGSTELSLSVYGNSELSSSIVFTQPAAGSVISLTLSTTNVDYAWDGGSGTLPIPAGFFANPPNVLVFSSGDTASHIADLSVRVAAQ